MPHELPKLPYAYDALEPYIDAKTVEIHHDKHHAAYVNNLNKLLEGRPELQAKTLDQILTSLLAIPQEIRAGVTFNAGGIANHNLYWSTMSPNAGGEPTGDLADAIKESFGSFQDFKQKLTDAAVKQFGSGWGWLTVDGNKLTISSTLNHDTPLSQGKKPILIVDVWEHAYYLKYQNKRADYVTNWWNLIDWDAVTKLFMMTTK
ncbi:Superoxide dismutase [Fe] [uncultured archaeon]|nr:Superoxide dismutase [Fe] [uncultured archaeon]